LAKGSTGVSLFEINVFPHPAQVVFSVLVSDAVWFAKFLLSQGEFWVWLKSVNKHLNDPCPPRFDNHRSMFQQLMTRLLFNRKENFFVES